MTAAVSSAPITVQAHKEKDRAPYVVNVGPKHLSVLRYLAERPKQGATDAQITFGLGLHMAAARRCELRDIGAVQRGGRRDGAWAWRINDKGRELLKRLEAQQ